MFELDVKAIAALGGCKVETPLAVHQYLETLTPYESYAILGGLQQRFGLRPLIASDPTAAVAEHIVSVQNELRSFESNVYGLLSLFSALNRFDGSIDRLELHSEELQVPRTTLTVLKLCRCYADGKLLERIQQVLTTRADEAIEANNREILNLFLSVLGASSHELLHGGFAHSLVTRILTQRILGRAPELLTTHMVSVFRELAGAVLIKDRARVSELVRIIDTAFGIKRPKEVRTEVVRAEGGGRFDWWSEQDWWREQP